MTVPKSRERVAGRDIQRGIIDLGRTHGWQVAHFPPVKTERGWRVPVGADGKGWPDLMLVRDRVLAIEVKGDGDSLRPDQKKWRDAFLLAGVEYVVATPRMWLDGEIDTVLRRRGPGS